jgi:hypothetical protein
MAILAMLLTSCALAIVSPPPPEPEPWHVAGSWTIEQPDTPEGKQAYALGTLCGRCFFIAIPVSFVGSIILHGEILAICKLVFVACALFFVLA